VCDSLCARVVLR